MSDQTMAALRSSAAYAVGPDSSAPSAASYQELPHESGGTRFERHDDRRDQPIARIGRRVADLVADLHLTLALHATDDVFVHAGVVAWNGRAILLPGRSRAGKSTLVHALVEAGATYLSDEYARITADGLIAPYPRPIHLRTDDGPELVDATSVGVVAVDPVPPGLVILTSYDPAAAFEPAPVSPANAALELLDNTVIAEIDPGRSAAAVASVARLARAVRTLRPDVAIAVPAILRLADEQVAAA